MSLQSKPKKHRTKKRVEFNVPEKEALPVSREVSHKETSKKEKEKTYKKQKPEYITAMDAAWRAGNPYVLEPAPIVTPMLDVGINYPTCDVNARAKCDSAFIIQHIVLVLIQMILCGAMLWLVTTIQNYPNWEQNSDAKRLYMMLLALIVVTLLTLGMAFWLKSAIVGFTFIVSVFLSIYVFMLFDDVKLTELKSDTQVQLTETPAFKWNRGIVLSQAVLSVLCIVSYVIYGRKIGEI